MNFIFSILGACILIVLGLVIGFWIEIASTPDLPNGFVECNSCGPSFAETERYWRKK